MSGTELQVLEIIWDWGGEAPINIVAKEARISIDYARLICQTLERHGYIDFLHEKFCKLKGKGRLEAAKRKVNSRQKKTVVEEHTFHTRGDGDQKEKFILEY